MISTKPLHICHVSSMHDDDDDRIFQRACTGTARAGHRVSYIVTSDSERDVNHVHIVPLQKRSGIKRRIFSSYEAYKKALQTNADIYQLHDPDLLPFMILLKWKGKKVVYDIHENYAVRFTNRGLPSFAEKLMMKAWRGYERFVIRRIDGIVVVTQSICNFFEDVLKDKVIVSNMTDIELLKDIRIRDFDSREKVLYVSGNNTPDRNVEELIRAMPLICAKVPETRLLIVGRYAEGYREQLQEVISSLELDKQVTLEGNLPWKENFDRTNQAYIGCVFWKKNENYSVTIPNRIFEYMFCGAAVLSDDTVELRSVVEQSGSGLLCNSEDPASIAEKAIRMLTHPAETKQMAANGRKAVLEKFNFNVQLEDMIRFYYRIINRK